jgi:hypothetical protein
MPLSPAADRDLLHTRAITIRGYRRADSLFDIEAELNDTKPYAFSNDDRGEIPAGEPLHGMFLRMTVDERLNIVSCEAVTDYGPYAICPSAAPNFARLAGLRIKPGFLRDALARVAGPEGCTHLRELLQQVATTAYQTLYSAKMRQGKRLDDKPVLLNTCLAYASDSPVVARRWPDLYRPKEAEAAE